MFGWVDLRLILSFPFPFLFSIYLDQLLEKIVSKLLTPLFFLFRFALFPSVSLYLAFGFRTECKLEDFIYLGRIWCWGLGEAKELWNDTCGGFCMTGVRIGCVLL